MSGGYGFWEKKLVIRGTIEVVKPEPAVTDQSTQNVESQGEN